MTKPDSLSESKLENAIESLTSAVGRRPDDAELRQSLGELWIYRYRQRAYRFWEQKAAENPEIEAPNWNAIGLAPLHRLANRALNEADSNTLDELRRIPAARENLLPARGHLLAARAACPLLPGIGLNLAMSDFFDEADPSGMTNVERAVALGPVNEDVLFTAGVLSEQASHGSLSRQYWGRCLSVGTRHQTEILNAVLKKMRFAEIVDDVLPQSPAVLLDLARTRFSGATHESERRLLIQKSLSILEDDKTGQPEADRMYWTGVGHHLSGQTARSIAMYQQAVNRQPDKIEWRLELAQTFREAGRLDEALREARLCASMSPKGAGVESLIRDLVRRQVLGSNRIYPHPKSDKSD